jgi:hypothetical protein
LPLTSILLPQIRPFPAIASQPVAEIAVFVWVSVLQEPRGLCLVHAKSFESARRPA